MGSSRTFNRSLGIVLLWVLVAGISSLILVGEHYSTREQNLRTIANEDLSNNVFLVSQTLSDFFQNQGRGLEYAGTSWNWPELLAQNAKDNTSLRNQLDQLASSIDSTSIDVADRYRAVVHAYWSEVPVVIEPGNPRDSWFVEMWQSEALYHFTPYEDEAMGGPALYWDRFVYGETGGEPIGTIGTLIPLSKLQTLITALSYSSSQLFLLDPQGKSILNVHKGQFTPNSQVYNLTGRKINDSEENDTTGTAILSFAQDLIEMGPVTDVQTIRQDSQFITLHPIEPWGLSFVYAVDLAEEFYDAERSLVHRLGFVIVVLLAAAVAYAIILYRFQRKTRGYLELLRQKDAQKEDLLYILSHQVSNRIQALRISDHCGVEAHLSALEQLVRNTIYWSRIQSSIGGVVRTKVSLDLLATRIETHWTPVLKNKDQVLEITVKGPDAATIDFDLCSHIIDNLVSNSSKYSPSGTVVTIELVHGGDNVVISVTDQGPGIEPGQKKQLFTRFSRSGARPSAQEHSSGLGLYVAKGLCDAIGGDLEYDWDYSGGARWLFTIPLWD